MKFLVTGGAGFIGSHLTDRLLQQGHEVTTLDDLSNGKYEYLIEARQHPNHSFIDGTILNDTLVNHLVRTHDGVFHLAAVLGVKNCVENPRKVIEGNVLGTKYILEACQQWNKKIVFASTSEIYGKNQLIPFREDSDRVLGSTMIHRWSYATAKALDEHLCLALVSEGLQAKILRYFNIYGPRSVGTPYAGVVPIFIRAALENRPITVYGDGQQSRCFTYVDDCITGTIAAMHSASDEVTFNIGTTVETTISEIALRIRMMTESSSPITFVPYKQAYGEGYEDMHRRVPDISRAKDILGYSPTVTLEDGLRATIEWSVKKYRGVI